MTDVHDLRTLAAQLQRLHQRQDELQRENERLRQELTLLRQQTLPPLAADVAACTSVEANSAGATTMLAVTADSSNPDKLALFKNLFRGREDVHAVRWTSPDGRAGYATAALSRAHRERVEYLPLTDAVLRDHLDGRRTAGVYPLLQDDTCWFLAADFDKLHWQDDVAAYMAVCDSLGVPAALERSRSGNGAHVWFFFSAPVPAVTARKLGVVLLTRAMEERHQIGLDSYDRLFPSQDTLPKGGFGNLIALPLQGESRRSGNTMFLDRVFAPHRDQRAHLSGTRRIGPDELESVIKAALPIGPMIPVRRSHPDDENEDPWVAPRKEAVCPPLAAVPPIQHIRMTLANLAYVPKEALPAPILGKVWRLAAFQNPEFYRAQSMRLPTFGKPRVISCAEDLPRHIGLPRGSVDDVRTLLTSHGIGVDLVDERENGKPIDVAFHGQLAPEQQNAARSVLRHNIGVLCAPTAFGKTVIAAWIIAQRKVNTLVLVHRRQLLDQWRDQRRLSAPPGPQSLWPLSPAAGRLLRWLRRDFRKSNDWKHLRLTPHNHHPVHDAMGNLEAFDRMTAGEG